MIRLLRSVALLAAVSLPLCTVSLDAAAEEGSGSRHAPLAASSLLLDVAPLDGGLIAVGARGHLLTGRETVRQILMPTDRLLTTVAVSGETILVGAHDAQILRSTDGGARWEVTYRDPDWGAPILDLLWLDGDTVIASGGFGLFLVSRDGGMTWELRDIDLDAPHFYALTRHGAAGVTIIGEFGTLWRTDDLDAPWRRLDVPYGGSLFGGIVLPDGRLLSYGLEGNAFLEGEGETFTTRDSGTDAALLDSVALDDGTVLVAGRAGAVLRFAPEAGTFTPVQRNDREDIAGIGVDDAGRVLAVGEQGIGHLDGAALDFVPIPLSAPEGGT
ncbi:MAG: hypothetical protein NXI16_08035 [Alphaproteobacteria bacterium]|nr:hypothetical protein [Alphaproteobacteria bacterium]